MVTIRTESQAQVVQRERVVIVAEISMEKAKECAADPAMLDRTLEILLLDVATFTREYFANRAVSEIAAVESARK